MSRTAARGEGRAKGEETPSITHWSSAARITRQFPAPPRPLSIIHAASDPSHPPIDGASPRTILSTPSGRPALYIRHVGMYIRQGGEYIWQARPVHKMEGGGWGECTSQGPPPLLCPPSCQLRQCDGGGGGGVNAGTYITSQISPPLSSAHLPASSASAMAVSGVSSAGLRTTWDTGGGGMIEERKGLTWMDSPQT